MRTPKTITDITERGFPQLGWVYDPNDSYGRGPLHIADQNCRQHGVSRSFTRCKKAVGFAHYFNNGKLRD